MPASSFGAVQAMAMAYGIELTGVVPWLRLPVVELNVSSAMSTATVSGLVLSGAGLMRSLV